MPCPNRGFGESGASSPAALCGRGFSCGGGRGGFLRAGHRRKRSADEVPFGSGRRKARGVPRRPDFLCVVAGGFLLFRGFHFPSVRRQGFSGGLLKAPLGLHNVAGRALFRMNWGKWASNEISCPPSPFVFFNVPVFRA